jgi:hypothetical protein
VPESHTATEQWQSFELRMRRRAFERCVVRAVAALDAEVLDDAREAFEEAQRLSPEDPQIRELASRLSAAEAPPPELAIRLTRAEAPLAAAVQEHEPVGAGSWMLAAVLILMSAAAGWFWAGAGLDGPQRTAPVVSAGAGAPSLPASTPPPPTIEPAPEPAPPPEPISEAGAAGSIVDGRAQPAEAPVSALRSPLSATRSPLSAVRDPTGTAGAGTSSDATLESKSATRPVAAATTDDRPVDRTIASGPANLGASDGPPAAPRPLAPDPPVHSAPVLPEALPAPAPLPAAIRTDGAAARAAESNSAGVLVSPPDVSANDERLVRAALNRYAAAYTGLDASAARVVWPSVDHRALARAFEGLAAQRVTLGRCDVRLNGASAQADCAGSATWTPKVGGGAQSASRRWRFDLRNSGGDWIIVQANVR